MIAEGFCMANINKKGFQYIWAFSSEKTIFKMSEAVSPYLEINSECLNKSNLQKKSEIEVNPYLRFNDLFSNFNYNFGKFISFGKFAKEIEKENIRNSFDLENNHEIKKVYMEIYSKIFDASMKYLQKLDFISGTTIIDIYLEKISEEIREGVYGKEISREFRKLSEEDKNSISLLLYNFISYHRQWSKIFEVGIKIFFKDSIIYQNRNRNSEVIVYINKEGTSINKSKIKILKCLFVPVDFDVKCYWKEHFGVIDVKETSKIGEIGVF